MAQWLSNGPCPSCGSRDNLAKYNDGSCWCWGCHYYESPNGRNFNPTVEKKEKGYSDPPRDLSFTFSDEARAWLDQYGMSLEELYNRNVRYSKERNQIIFIMDHGVWQARNLNKESKSRYYTQGDVNDHLPIYYAGNVRGGDNPVRTPLLVLVEDCISAIKIARQCDAMPLLGSNISATKLARLARYYSEVIFWLDADKYVEAQKLASRAKLLGLSTRVVYTDKDPKEYDDVEILQRLDTKAKGTSKDVSSG